MAANGKTMKRLGKELRKLQKSPPAYLASVGPVDDENMLLWHATFVGPEGSPYAGGLFEVEVALPESYPMQPPVLKFLTQIYHPSVSMAEGGAICKDLVAAAWSPVLGIADVLAKLHAALEEPTAIQSPLDTDIGEVIKNDPAKFISTAKAWTKKYAKAQ